jgi:hypothetical protein
MCRHQRQDRRTAPSVQIATSQGFRCTGREDFDHVAVMTISPVASRIFAMFCRWRSVWGPRRVHGPQRFDRQTIAKPPYAGDEVGRKDRRMPAGDDADRGSGRPCAPRRRAAGDPREKVGHRSGASATEPRQPMARSAGDLRDLLLRAVAQRREVRSGRRTRRGRHGRVVERRASQTSRLRTAATPSCWVGKSQ